MNGWLAVGRRDRTRMYFAAILSLAASIFSASVAFFWRRVPGTPAEHWTVRRKRLAKARANQKRAFFLGAAAILLSSAEVLRSYVAS